MLELLRNCVDAESEGAGQPQLAAFALAGGASAALLGWNEKLDGEFPPHRRALDELDATIVRTQELTEWRYVKRNELQNYIHTYTAVYPDVPSA